MKDRNGFTIVEILVVVVILAVVGLIIMISVIPRIEDNAKNNFITDAKLYIQQATEYFSDKKVEDSSYTSGCISISELNKLGIDLANKKDYSGYISITLDKDEVKYDIAITNKYYYTYNRTNNTYVVDSDKLISENLLDDYDSVEDFPTKCSSK